MSPIAHEASSLLTRLEREDDADLQELAAAVSRLLAEVRALRAGIFDETRPSALNAPYASPRWLERVDEAARHLREAGDLLDDGMPPDSAAFEMGAAIDCLEAAMTGPLH
jgi:hypothetical protein